MPARYSHTSSDIKARTFRIAAAFCDDLLKTLIWKYLLTKEKDVHKYETEVFDQKKRLVEELIKQTI